MAGGTQDPALEDVIREFVRVGLAKVHTSFPATIVAYNPVLQTATIQPALHARVDDVLLDTERPDALPPPQLSNVPVMWPSGGGVATGWSVHGPLTPGDPVTVVVAERSTDEWRTIGAPTNIPLDARRFDLSDAVCYPGGRSASPTNPLTAPLGVGAVDPAALVLAGTFVKLGSGPAAVDQVLKGTTFEVDLLAWLSAFSALITAFLTPPVPPVGAPGAVAWITAVQAAALTFQTAHNTFTATVSSGAHRSLKVTTE